MDHFDRWNILTDKQHGFRRRRSCESQLIITIDALGKSLAKGEQVDVILLDFSKAFDIKGSPSSTASQAGLLWNERKHLEMGTGFLE
jgi:hypothetical protein